MEVSMFKANRIWAAVLLALTVFSLPLTGARPTSAWTGINIPFCGPKRPVTHTVFNATTFPTPTRIDNKWLPMVPGSQYTLDGTASTGGAPTGHRVVTTVTNMTKMIGNVRTLVIWDRDYQDGQLQEAELAFFAQDADGNVWNFGEYPELYDPATGAFNGAPSTWIAGIHGAEPGVHMLASPNTREHRYSQGYSGTIQFYDCAQVFATDQTATTPFATFHGALITDENSPLDPASGHQRKFQAYGVGIVEVTAVNDPEGETLGLTGLARLNASQLQAADNAVLALDRHGHQAGVNDVYRQSQPVQ
jgi:hypothetical protein